MSKGDFKKGNTAAAKYKDEYCEKMLAYFQSDRGFPTFETFAASIGVVRSTLNNWCEKHARFRHIYARCKDIQLGKTIEGALCRRYEPSFAKFICTACHGLREKTETDATLRFEVELPQEIDEESD